MNRFTIAAAVAATACIIGIPTVAALASDDSTHSRGPSHSQVDDRGGPNRGSDDVSPTSVVPTSGASEPGDDNGTHAEPGDDRGTSTEPGDDNGTGVEPGDDRDTGVEPGDDRGTGVEPGDDRAGHGGRGGSGDNDGGHHGHGG
jgi:hypothetical protein